MKRTTRQNTSRPSAVLGAGKLVSAVWNTAHPISAGSCHFNVYRMSPSNGRVSRLLRSTDIPDLVKLCQVLSLALADDDSVSLSERRALAELALKLDEITRSKE